VNGDRDAANCRIHAVVRARSISIFAMANAPKTPAVGEKAPAFSVLDDRGEQVSLADFKGQNVVLYFYPKDDTPG
jgi:peroxiredoxin